MIPYTLIVNLNDHSKNPFRLAQRRHQLELDRPCLPQLEGRRAARQGARLLLAGQDRRPDQLELRGHQGDRPAGGRGRVREAPAARRAGREGSGRQPHPRAARAPPRGPARHHPRREGGVSDAQLRFRPHRAHRHPHRPRPARPAALQLPEPPMNRLEAAQLVPTLRHHAVTPDYDLFVRAQLEGDRIVFRGGLRGPHSLDVSNSTEERVLSHWNGYVESATYHAECERLAGVARVLRQIEQTHRPDPE